MALSFGNLFNSFFRYFPERKVGYISINPSAFTAGSPDTDDVGVSAGTVGPEGAAANIILTAPVNLPEGATVTSAVVYGTFDETWLLSRSPVNTNTIQNLASSTAGAIDKTIFASYELVDNQRYSYAIWVNLIDSAEFIHGAVVTYII